MSNIIKIKKALTSKDKEDHPVPSQDLLSTGSVLLNLAATGRLKGGLAKEDYALIVGDSQAGKTWLSLTILAEAANNPEFKDYALIYDSVENGAKMNFSKFFGSKMAKRTKPPGKDHSSTVQEFYFNLDDAVSKGPCIYVLDSMDGLDAEEDIEHFEKQKSEFRRGKELSGSYGMAKAKINSTSIRAIIRKLRKTKSILIIISQTRDKVGGNIPGQKTRGGGRSLKFYAHIEVWLSIKKDIQKKLQVGSKKKMEQQGIIAKIKVEKSRHTGREKAVEIPIYWSHGIDDTGSCVDYLVESGYWRKKNGVIIGKDLNVSGKREGIIATIEEQEMESDLHKIVKKVWNDLDAQLAIHRKKKYE